jgi:hypothetical protein
MFQKLANSHLQAIDCHYTDKTFHCFCRWEDISIYLYRTRERVGRCEQDVSESGSGPMAGSSENGNELSGSIKDREFLE